jgi:hypothetical protein
MTISTVLSIMSCQKQDHAYKDFIADGERIYLGKVTELVGYSGNGRVKLSWNVFDSRIKKIKIKYNDDLDSVLLDVVKTDQIDAMETLITGLEERTYTFKVFALDGIGNQSVVQQVDCQSFGDNYRSTLNNRIISERTISGTNVTVNWVALSNDSNVEETEIEYVDVSNGEQKTVVMPKASRSIVLPNVDRTKAIRYRTKYYPTANAIDHFYTEYTSYTL